MMTDRLRPMTAHDLGQVLSWRNHPDVRCYMYTQRLITLDEHQQWFARAVKAPDKRLMIYEQDDQATGFVNFHVLDNSASIAEWGFYLAPGTTAGSGKRLGTCALKYAFTVLHLNKLCGEVLANNARSLRFHERLGFHQEAILGHHFFDGAHYHDVICFELLNEEWRRQQKGIFS